MLRRLFLAAVLCSSCAAHAQLPEAVATLLRAANIPEQAVGVVVMRGNKAVVSHNAERSMHPASTMKLLTTVVALEQLGPIFRGRTELRTSAELVNGVLMGDLILRGGADADLTADVLEHMLQTLRNRGIQTIRGDVLFDRQLFQPSRPDLGVAPFDDKPEFRYNVIPDALLINTSLVQIDLSASDRKLDLILFPALEKVTLTSDMQLIEADCARWEEGWRTPDTVRGENGTLRIALHGTFPKNCVKSTSINVLDRQDYAERLFRATWRRLGGAIGGAVREASPPTVAPTAATPETRLLADHVARALPEVVRDINKNSDNTLARMLYLSLGSLETDAYFGSHPIAVPAQQNSALRAEQIIRAWLRRHNIDDAGLTLDNGSGLSRVERIRPAQMAALLQAASASLWAPEFLSSLPIAALDGTMRRRMQGSPAASRARIKTGSVKNVIAIAGYVPDAGNVPCVVVAMINHDLVGNGVGRAVLDALIDWVARSGPQPE